MNELMNSINAIDTNVMQSSLDVEDAILEYYDKHTEMNDNDEIVQEFTLLELLIAAPLIGIAANIARRLTERHYLNKFSESLGKEIVKVANLVRDESGNTDGKMGVKNFRKLKKALSAISALCFKTFDYLTPAMNSVKRKYYSSDDERTVAEFVGIAHDIMRDQKVIKRRAKKQDDTSDFSAQLEKFFKLSEKVIDVAEKNKPSASKAKTKKTDETTEAPAETEQKTESTEE